MTREALQRRFVHDGGGKEVVRYDGNREIIERAEKSCWTSCWRAILN
jgi:hypothetical protein